MKNIFDDVLQMTGNTPLVKIRTDLDGDCTCYVKLEGSNPTGSVKDRAALALIRAGIASGQLKSGMHILDASSGSFACSLSYFGHILGYPVTVVTGSKLTLDKKAFIEYFGAALISHGDFTIQGNAYCREVLMAEAPGKYCFLDQLHNPGNPMAHFTQTGPEIFEAVPDVAAIVFSLGSGGTLNGISRYIRESGKATKVIAVTSAAGTKIPGTGSFVDGDYITPFIAEMQRENRIDYTAEVNLAQAGESVIRLRRQGIFAGIQTGAVFHGMQDGIRALGIKGKVVMISGDAGWKNMDKLAALPMPAAINVLETGL